MRILAVDHGEKNLGIAISDPTGTLARPLKVIRHTSRKADAEAVFEAAREFEAGCIVVGQSFDEEGQPNPAGRSAARFANELQALGSIPVVLWDESHSTRDALRIRIEMGVKRSQRKGHQDDQAAAIILQSYLDTHPQPSG